MVREATQRKDEDGYAIVADYLASLNHDERQRRELETSRLAGDAYRGPLVRKYASDMPVWVYVELLTFGAFANLYRFCSERWHDQRMKDEHYLLRQAKDARNAYAHGNTHARHLYERLGFQQLGTIPGGFRMKDGHYENICPYYHEV